jgi:hypothetical protein
MIRNPGKHGAVKPEPIVDRSGYGSGFSLEDPDYEQAMLCRLLLA